MSAHHAGQPPALLRDGLIPAYLELVFDAFARAIGEFAGRYAEQNQRDHTAGRSWRGRAGRIGLAAVAASHPYSVRPGRCRVPTVSI
jgi:hypothetical protein